MNKYVNNFTLPNGTNVLIKDLEGRTNLSNEIRRATAKETELEDSYTHLRNDLKTEANAREQGDNTLQQNINAEASDRTEQYNALNARISQFTKLPEGSTAGDAELNDIRVGANGKTYDTAGDAVRGQFSELKSDLTNFKNNKWDNVFEDKVSKNLLNPALVQNNGYFLDLSGNKTPSDRFVQYEITNVQKGKTYYFRKFDNGLDSVLSVRFITVYDSDGTANQYIGKENQSYYEAIEPYEGALGKIVLTIDTENGNAIDNVWTIKINDDTLTTYPYFDPYIGYTQSGENVIRNIINTNEPSRYISKSGNLNSGSSIILAINNIKSAKRTSFVGKITTFDKLYICNGITGNQASYIVIDNTHIRQYNYYSNASQYKVWEHGLTIGTDIEVHIDVSEDLKAKIRICSQGQWYECASDLWHGCIGQIEAYSDGSVLTDCVLSFTAQGYWGDVQYYGDSYFGMDTNDRWMYYLVNDGYSKNTIIDGFPGRGSSEALNAFKENIKHSIPKYAVWCLGMNDGDSESSYNSTWKNCLDVFLELCNEKNIIPILATIPTTPTVNNNFKNEYIRNSDYRYIDFSKAVKPSDTSTSWYDGMLNTDNLHPTEKGAKALYMRVLVDFPESMRK